MKQWLVRAVLLTVSSSLASCGQPQRLKTSASKPQDLWLSFQDDNLTTAAKGDVFVYEIVSADSGVKVMSFTSSEVKKENEVVKFLVPQEDQKIYSSGKCFKILAKSADNRTSEKSESFCAP